MKPINMLSLEKIIFVDSIGIEMIIKDISVEKLDSLINEYHILGHNGDENCSGADVGIEFSSIPNSCTRNNRHCCNLAGVDENASRSEDV